VKSYGSAADFRLNRRDKHFEVRHKYRETPLVRELGEDHAAVLEAASNGEEQTRPENCPQSTRSGTIKICRLEQPHVGQFRTQWRISGDWRAEAPSAGSRRTSESD
jgi:hypothetical protein